MAAKRTAESERQTTFAWADPIDVLAASEDRGRVVFEAPESSRLVRGRAPRVPRVRVRRAAGEPPSIGLPFGVREIAGRITCWSCGQDLDEHETVRTGPGAALCPGCGARLPFVE